MAARRLVVELTLGDDDVTKLMAMTRSRTEPASRVERARMLLAYRDDPSFFAVGCALGVHHQTVQRCVERAVAFGPLAALDDSPRPGRRRRSRPRPRNGWLILLAEKPRISAIPMSFGQPGSWPAMRANMGRPPGMPALPIWSRARCAKSSTRAR